MSMRRTILAGFLLGTISLAGAAAQTDDAAVMIDNFTFTPAEITISAGTKVIWTNRDDIPHTVTDAANPKDYRSKPMDTGDTFSHVFDKAGTYKYFCSLHPHMQGTVIVR